MAAEIIPAPGKNLPVKKEEDPLQKPLAYRLGRAAGSLLALAALFARTRQTWSNRGRGDGRGLGKGRRKRRKWRQA